MRTESGSYRRDHLRALAQRVEVDAKEVRIMGSKNVLLRTLVAASSAIMAGFDVPSFVPKWRALRDSNPCYRRERADMMCMAVHRRPTKCR
jgi:site-specific DNA recombinase